MEGDVCVRSRSNRCMCAINSDWKILFSVHSSNRLAGCLLADKARPVEVGVYHLVDSAPLKEIIT